MALPDITFIKGEGGLKRVSEGEDFYTGIVFYGTKPVLFGTDTVKLVGTTKEAEAFGLTELAYPVQYYHISEFFRINPNALLYVGFFTTPVSTYNFNEVLLMQSQANGKLRQIGVYVALAFAVQELATLQARYNELFALKTPAHLIYAPNIGAVSDLSTLPNIRTGVNSSVSVCIGQDGAGAGDLLYTSASISCIGAMLGTIAKSAVHENIAWIERFNASNGFELETPAFANGQLVKDISGTVISGLNDKGYIFLRKVIGIDGTYFNDSHTATLVTSDYAYIENNRAIDKAIREIYKALLPNLSSPVYADPTTGKLSEITVRALEATAENPLNTMIANGELSGARVEIDENQNVLSTSKVVVNAQLVPVGVARTIEVQIGYTLNLNSN